MIEYEYETEDILSASDGVCFICDEKMRKTCDLAICGNCSMEMLISKTGAKKIYKLTDDDLENLDFITRKNQYTSRKDITLYFIKDVRLMAINKKFGAVYPSKEIYEECVKEILDEYETKQENKIPREDIKKSKLKQALRKVGLKIRDDSYYCNQYIHHNKFKLKEVVDMMVSMDFFMNKTKYSDILQKIIDDRKDADGDGDDSDGDDSDDDYHIKKYYTNRHYISEEDKYGAKLQALKKYLKRHGIDTVPKPVVRDFYENLKWCIDPDD